MKLGVGKFQAAFCGVLLLLPSAIIHAAPGDRGRILPPEFVRPVRENMLADKSRVVQLLMEKSNREQSKVEPLLHTKPSRIPTVVRRDAVEEIYRRSPGNAFVAFPRANQKRFRHVSANSTSDAYHTGRMQIHGRDLDN